MSDRRGVQRLTCRLLLDTGRSWTYTLQVRVREPLWWDPRDIDLGECRLGTVLRRIFHLYSLSAQEPAISAAETGLRVDALTVRALSEYPIEGINNRVYAWEVDVSLRASDQPGKVWLNLLATDALGNAASLKISGTNRSFYHVSPCRLVLTTSNDGARRVAKILLRHTQGETFAILQVRSSHPAVCCSPCSIFRRSDVHLLQIDFNPCYLDTKAVTPVSVPITTDWLDESQITIPITLLRRKTDSALSMNRKLHTAPGISFQGGQP